MSAKRQAKELLMFLLGGLFMAGIGIWSTLGALGIIKLKILVAPWIVVCAGFMFIMGGVMMLSPVYAAVLGTKKTATKTASSTISPVEKGSYLFNSWFVTIFVLLLVSMFWGLIFTDAKFEGDMPMWMFKGGLLLFTFLGLLSLAYAIWLTSNALLFGNIKLHIHDYPPRVGNEFSASFRLPPRQSLNSIEVTLKCYQLVASNFAGIADGSPGDIKDSLNQFMSPKWQETKHVALKRRSYGYIADITFSIPDNLPVSNWFVYSTQEQIQASFGGSLCRWVLEIKKDIAGPNLKRTYEVPMHPAKVVEEETEVTDEIIDDMSRDEAIMLITKTELDKGTAPDAVITYLNGLGISKLMAIDAMRELLHSGKCKNENILLDYLVRQNRAESAEREKRESRIKRIRKIVLQNRKENTEEESYEISELEFKDIVRYIYYLSVIIPILYALFTLITMN